MQPRHLDPLDLWEAAEEPPLPPMTEIPKDFWLGDRLERKTKWNDVVFEWFFHGLPHDADFIVKRGIDRGDAIRHVADVLRSRLASHEYKEAAAAYLMSQWVDDVKLPNKGN